MAHPNEIILVQRAKATGLPIATAECVDILNDPTLTRAQGEAAGDQIARQARALAAATPTQGGKEP